MTPIASIGNNQALESLLSLPRIDRDQCAESTDQALETPISGGNKQQGSRIAHVG